jgi:hypothetical protein
MQGQALVEASHVEGGEINQIHHQISISDIVPTVTAVDKKNSVEVRGLVQSEEI